MGAFLVERFCSGLRGGPPQALVPVAAPFSEQDFAVVLPKRLFGLGDGRAADLLQGKPVPPLDHAYGHDERNAQAYTQA
eukprot:11207718-Lingulodinium_polyedra.AAC.1